MVTPHAQVPRSKRILLIVDFINPLDFPGGDKLAPPALLAAKATLRLRERLAKQKVAVVYANDNYGFWQSDFRSIVVQHMKRDDISGEIARMLAPQEGHVTLLKPRHSAFYNTALELLLKEMGGEELILCGLSTDMCVQMTAADAFLRRIKVVVPSDCTAAETPEAKATALKYMKTILKCEVKASRSIK